MMKDDEGKKGNTLCAFICEKQTTALKMEEDEWEEE